MCTPCRIAFRAAKSKPVYYERGQRHKTGTSRSHTSKIVPKRLAKRAWCTESQSSSLNIYFRHSGFQSLLHLFTSTTVRIPVLTATKSFRNLFAPSQKSHQNHRSYVCFSGRRNRNPVQCENNPITWYQHVLVQAFKPVQLYPSP